ncbi:MAG: flagellar basal body rod protein FlgB [Clostridia bacterium]|nr:flagellar basal body rod protein FlgB [Clostridia bacterium]
MNVFGNINSMEKAMDVLSMRNQIINNNIANVDTPGFKRSGVVFEELLDENIMKLKGKVTRDQHIPIGKKGLDQIQPIINKQNKTRMRMDGNNVDIDYEMAELAKNTLQYNSVSTQISRQLRKIKTAITGGR